MQATMRSKYTLQYRDRGLNCQFLILFCFREQLLNSVIVVNHRSKHQPSMNLHSNNFLDLCTQGFRVVDRKHQHTIHLQFSNFLGLCNQGLRVMDRKHQPSKILYPHNLLDLCIQGFRAQVQDEQQYHFHQVNQSNH